MPEKIQVAPALLQRMVGFIEKSGKAIEKLRADREQAKQAAPEAVKMLVKQGLLDPARAEDAASALGESHTRTIETLRRTATHVKNAAEGAPAPMGQPAAPMGKQASVAPKTNMEQADEDFLSKFGF